MRRLPQELIESWRLFGAVLHCPGTPNVDKKFAPTSWEEGWTKLSGLEPSSDDEWSMFNDGIWKTRIDLGHTWTVIFNFLIFWGGLLGAVRKSRRGSSVFVFYCIFMTQFFKVFWGGSWGATLPPPRLCASMISVEAIIGLVVVNEWPWVWIPLHSI